MVNHLAVEELSTYFYTNRGIVKAVDHVSFSVKKGEMMGLIGESGCGKTTVGQSLLQMIQSPGKIVSGKIWINEIDLLKASSHEVDKLRWNTLSMIPQSSMNSLNPVFRVGEQIAESIRIHKGIRKQEALERACELLDLVGIGGSRWKSYPHEFSGGMKQRVAIAMALSCRPQFVISDEATTGLDVLTQAQIIGLIKKFQKDWGLSVIFISHDLPLVTSICERVIIMYAGKIVEWGKTEDILKGARHPYSQGLLQAIPQLYEFGQACYPIPGSVPDLINPPKGCRFHSRCPYAVKRCQEEEPALKRIGGSEHHIACFLWEDSGHEFHSNKGFEENIRKKREICSHGEKENESACGTWIKP